MNAADVARIAAHITDSWPTQTLDPAQVKLWADKDFNLLDFETMVYAVDFLRTTQDFLPTTRQLIETHGKIWVENHPRLPAHSDVSEQDPRRPYNLAWRLLMETWMQLKAATMRASADQASARRAKAMFLRVNDEIQKLDKAQRELMPVGPDAVAPERLVALAVAAQERVRALLFGAEGQTGAQDAPESGAVGHLPAESVPPPEPAMAMPFDDSRVEDPDDFIE